MQESNTFAPRAAVLKDFEIRSGAALVEFFRNTNSEVAGFLDGCQEQGWEGVPMLSANAISGGTVTYHCFEAIAARILESVRNTRLDGLLVALHGAMSTEHHLSGDAEIAKRLRSTLGDQIPIAVSHDLHANVRPELLQAIDGISGYLTYPHIDQRETGYRSSDLLGRLFAGESLQRWRLPIPALLSPQWSSTCEPPLKGIVNELRNHFPAADACATLFCVQPWLDLAAVSGSVVVTSWKDENQIRDKMKHIARQFWGTRNSYRANWTAPEQLMAAITASSQHPVLVSEGYDAPTGGAAGDHTGLLELLVRVQDTLRCCLYIVDPAMVNAAFEAGLGARVKGCVGATMDTRYSKPVTICGEVIHLSDGSFIGQGPAFAGREFSMGRTAVILVEKIRLLVASVAVMMIDPMLFRSQGIEPADLDVVGIKSPSLFRPNYESISQAVVYLDLPGSCYGRIENVPFQNINRPIFPLDQFDWEPPEPQRFLSRAF